MRRFLLLFLSLLLPRCAITQREAPIVITAENGEFYLLRTVTDGKEFWLHPRCELEAAWICAECAEKHSLTLKLRFWEASDLAEAKRLLRRDGWCRPGEACRVFPPPASRIAIQDSRGRWEPHSPWFALSGLLPRTKEVSVRPAASAGGLSNSSLAREALTSFEVIVSSTSSDSAAATEHRDLSITGEELLWAQRLFQIPAGRNQLIDRATLRRLASWLLSAKRRQMGARLSASPDLLEKLERSIMLADVAFRRGLEALLPKGYRARRGERLFVLKSLGVREQVSVPLRPATGYSALTMEVKVAKGFNMDSFPDNSSAGAASDVLRDMREELTALSKAFSTQLATLQAATASSLNQSQKLLRRSINAIAAAVGQSHLSVDRFVNLTAVDDCGDVGRRQRKSGIYFLRVLQRPALCTADGHLVALQRGTIGEEFNRSWVDYQLGIGEAGSSDFFIGLEALSALTRGKDVCMTLILQPRKANEGERRAVYDNFVVGPKRDKYRLMYGAQKGNLALDVLSDMNHMRFSTYDNDNDAYLGSCAHRFSAGGWFNNCGKLNMFGPIRNGRESGLCSKGLLSAQGDTCTPISHVKMLLKRKTSTDGSRQIVFSAIAENSGSCKAKLQVFKVPASGPYRVTIGGATGGRNLKKPNNGRGGRGAKIQAELFLEGNEFLAASAGCRGLHGDYAGHGGDASWLVSRSKQVLLAVAGGGGGSSVCRDNYYLPGLPGRASPDGGDAWHDFNVASRSAKSVLMMEYFGTRAKGWPDLRHRLLSATSGNFSSGGKIGSCYGGGGGGGFEGGAGCSSGDDDAGGGGGSYCNATEVASCSVTEGGNTRPHGFVIIERLLCF